MDANCQKLLPNTRSVVLNNYHCCCGLAPQTYCCGMVQDPLLLWGLTDRRRYFPPAAAASVYLAASAAGQLASGFTAGADSLLYEHARELPYLIRCCVSEL